MSRVAVQRAIRATLCRNLDRHAKTPAATICAHPLDAVKTVKTFLRHAPSMEPGGRAEFAASLFATALYSGGQEPTRERAVSRAPCWRNCPAGRGVLRARRYVTD